MKRLSDQRVIIDNKSFYADVLSVGRAYAQFEKICPFCVVDEVLSRETKTRFTPW
jgi:hypothetical protein